MAQPVGFEPTANRLEGDCSIPLSYGCFDVYNYIASLKNITSNIQDLSNLLPRHSSHNDLSRIAEKTNRHFYIKQDP
jgi:hypothetical protein